MKLETAIDEKYRITDSKMLKEYIHGTQAYLTLVGPSGTAHMYLFARPRNADDFPADIRFIYAVHENTKFYLGMLEGMKFRCTRNSRFAEDCEVVKGAKYIVNLAKSQPLLTWTTMKLYQSGKCARCGRALDSEFGLIHGFGKSCWRKHLAFREMEGQADADLRSTTL